MAAKYSDLSYSQRLAKAQEDARDMLEVFMFEHGFDKMLNEKAEIAQKYIEDNQLERKAACTMEVSVISGKLSEYFMLVGEATPMSVSAGVAGIGEVLYKLPTELKKDGLGCMTATLPKRSKLNRRAPGPRSYTRRTLPNSSKRSLTSTLERTSTTTGSTTFPRNTKVTPKILRLALSISTMRLTLPARRLRLTGMLLKKPRLLSRTL